MEVTDSETKRKPKSIDPTEDEEVVPAKPTEPSPIPEPRSIDWGGFSDADASQPLLRTGKYLRTKKQSDKKPTDRPALAQFIGSEMFISTEECPQHIAQCKKSQYYEMIQKDQSDRFYIVINNRATAKLTSCCTWWYLDAHIFEENPNFAKLWWKFCEGTDEFRNQRFKCYPRIIDGSWSLKMMVPNVPTLLGQKVPVAYFKGRNYIELGIECDNNYLAKSILRIAFPISKSLVIDQCYILQTDTEEELPELVFAGVRYTKIDLTKAISVDEEPVRE